MEPRDGLSSFEGQLQVCSANGSMMRVCPARRSTGWHLIGSGNRPGPVLYGYDADPVDKQLVPNRSEARRVRAIFKRARGAADAGRNRQAD